MQVRKPTMWNHKSPKVEMKSITEGMKEEKALEEERLQS
jgi:hypothetical protein